VFPSGGILLLPIDEFGLYHLPAANDIADLPVKNIETPGDLSVVFVDVSASNIVVRPDDNVVVAAVLQFPEGGMLPPDVTGVGPGIGADGEEPDQDCDFFTVDGGEVWWSPFHDPDDPESFPLDWGFVVTVEPVVSVEHLSWTHVKQLYRTP
jgi:hypothetical protein